MATSVSILIGTIAGSIAAIMGLSIYDYFRNGR